jgi:osmotically-inducible protein OsmY
VIYYRVLPSLLLPLLALLQGCVAAAATGAVTGTAIAYDRRTTGTIIEDQAIELKAYRALKSDAEVDEKTHINVTSYNKAVLLTGEAPTEELRARTVDLVRNIPEVTQVFNEITIAAPSSLMSRSSDSVITTKVKTKLFGEKGIDATKVKVVTEKGVVYLMGLLTPEEGDIATEASRQVGGVQKVVKLFQYIEPQSSAN